MSRGAGADQPPLRLRLALHARVPPAAALALVEGWAARARGFATESNALGNQLLHVVVELDAAHWAALLGAIEASPGVQPRRVPVLPADTDPHRELRVHLSLQLLHAAAERPRVVPEVPG